MKNDINQLLTLLYTVIASQSLLLAIVFFLKKDNKLANKIEEMKKDVQSRPKYTKQRLEESTEMKILDDLLLYMKNEKPYLDNNLTLKQLSEEVSIPTHLITMVLNLHRNQNYYSFINNYRIKEACRMLSDREHSHKNILTIAMDSGFNSKSTFNTLFRKTIGLTPGEFRNRQYMIPESIPFQQFQVI